VHLSGELDFGLTEQRSVPRSLAGASANDADLSATSGQQVMSKLDSQVDGRELRRYFTTLSDALAQTSVTSVSGDSLEMAEAVNRLMADARRDHAAGNKLVFVGNGGSAYIACHMATDSSMYGNVRTLALNE